MSAREAGARRRFALVVRFESGLELTVQRSDSAGALELATWSRWPVGRYVAFAAGTRVDSTVASRRVQPNS